MSFKYNETLKSKDRREMSGAEICDLRSDSQSECELSLGSITSVAFGSDKQQLQEGRDESDSFKAMKTHGKGLADNQIDRLGTNSLQRMMFDDANFKKSRDSCEVNNNQTVEGDYGLTEGSNDKDKHLLDSNNEYNVPFLLPKINLDTKLSLLSLSDAYKACQEEWAERGAAKVVKDVADPQTGKVSRQVIRKGIKDFKFGENLGDGSYSTVVVATCIHSGKKYAAKVLNKRYLIKQKKVKYVNIEKNTLQRLNNSHIPGVIKLYFTFQDEANLYFLLEYASNGDFLGIMKRYSSLNEECVRYYGAQIISAISYLHRNGIIHRDIKPENILLDKDMKVKLADFGTAKLLEINEQTNEYDLYTRSKSFVGTAEYVSPELLSDNWVDHRCDIWAFGCIIFQMIAGKPPFKAANEYLIFQKVMKVQYSFTAGFPMAVRNLVGNLLVKKPEQRLTIEQIERHPFFAGLNFHDGSIWSNPVPELGPYKVTAKAMQPISGLQKKTSKTNKGTENSKTNHRNNVVMVSNAGSATPRNLLIGNESSSIGLPSRVATERDDPETSFLRSNSKLKLQRISNASAAATAALNRFKPSGRGLVATSLSNGFPQTISYNTSLNAKKSASENAKQMTLHTPPHSAPILTSAVPSDPLLLDDDSIKASTCQKSDSTTEYNTPSLNFKSVPPMNRYDIYWSHYLTKLDERIIKTGEVSISILNSEELDLKIDRLNEIMIEPLKNKARTTLLSQVVRNGGNFTGFRTGEKLGILNEEDYYKESYINWDDVDNDYKESMGESPESETVKNHSRFRRLFFPQKGAETTELFDFSNYRKKKMVVTTYDRCLILVKTLKPSKDTKLLYELQYEIQLGQKGMYVKKVVYDTQGDSGFFFIKTPFSSFVFKCHKTEINEWLNALKLSLKKTNERIETAINEVEPNPLANTAAKLSVYASSRSSYSALNNAPLKPTPCFSETRKSSQPVKTYDSMPRLKRGDLSLLHHQSLLINPEMMVDYIIPRKNHSKQLVQPISHYSGLLHGLPIKSSNDVSKLPVSSNDNRYMRHSRRSNINFRFSRSERPFWK